MADRSDLPDPARDAVGRVHAMLAARDPELLAPVDEVDRTLIRAWLARDPWERVRLGYEGAVTLREMAACLATAAKR